MLSERSCASAGPSRPFSFQLRKRFCASQHRTRGNRNAATDTFLGILTSTSGYKYEVGCSTSIAPSIKATCSNACSNRNRNPERRERQVEICLHLSSGGFWIHIWNLDTLAPDTLRRIPWEVGHGSAFIRRKSPTNLSAAQIGVPYILKWFVVSQLSLECQPKGSTIL